jgi:hypothetical protein
MSSTQIQNFTEASPELMQKLSATWEKCFKQNFKPIQLKRRLKELETWDHASGHEFERQAKIMALRKILKIKVQNDKK